MIVIYPNRQSGSPGSERVKAFSNYFLKKGNNVREVFFPEGVLGKVFFVLRFLTFRGTVLVSQPPFRLWWLLFFPWLKVILDIRDGWSIAMCSGYGGVRETSDIKIKLAQFIEKIAIKKASLVITCTPGLRDYLEKLSKVNIKLVPNGVSKENIDLINSLMSGNPGVRLPINSLSCLKVCCLGKFGEYGEKNCKAIIKMMADRYINKRIVIKLIGSDLISNSWVEDYVEEEYKGRVKVEISKRLNKKDLFKEALDCNMGIALVRDPSYELGTKAFDYIALGLPIFNCFDKENQFTCYFDGYFDVNVNKKERVLIIEREAILYKALDEGESF